jgi:diaminohydroxyphosphoribosylaminopyrimidine deaminase/5-amino-6-(5-phosphoribosylamino)uracil reductase
MIISSKVSHPKPKVILSTAMSLDGQIATVNGDVRLSNSEDWARVHHLRSQCDAIMVGSGTILADDSKLTVNPNYFEKEEDIHNPIRIVVSSNGEIPLNARVITFLPTVPTIIATTTKCSEKQQDRLREKKCQIIICGDGPIVNLNLLMESLKTQYEINTVLLEGGSILNGNMLSEQLIDEVHLAIAPVVGGKGTPFFTFPYNLASFDQSPFFEILSHKTIGDMIWIHLAIHYRPRHLI